MKNLILISILITLSIPAIANTIGPGGGYTNWEIYVLGGSSIFKSIFDAMIMFTSSPVFKTLVTVVALLGFLLLMIQNTGGLDGKKIGFYFLAIWGAAYFTFIAKVDLTIIDSLGKNPASNGQVVTNVPAAIGLPAAFISDVGETFTQQIDVFFQRPNEHLQFANTKTLNMEATIINDLMTANPFPTSVTKTLAEFYVNCLYPSVLDGTLTLDTIMSQNDILGYLQIDANAYINPALTTTDYTQVAETLSSCDDIIDTGESLHTAMKAATDDFILGDYNLSNFISKNDSTSQSTASLGALATSILSNVNKGNDNTASNLVVNRSMARAFQMGVTASNASVGLNRGTLQEILIEEQTLAQVTSGWKMAIQTFNSMSGYIYSTLHAFILGISPLILVFLFIPGVAGKAILSYMQILVWLALWQPMLAIVNFIIVSFQDNALTATNLSNSDVSLNDAANMNSWLALSAATEKYTLAAGFLGTSVPLISWGLVKGGMSFSQFISSGIGTSVAQGAAKNLATGTFSMDNSSFNNTSGNKTDTVSSFKTGFGQSEYHSMHGRSASVIQSTGAHQFSEGGHKRDYEMKAATEKSISMTKANGASLSVGQDTAVGATWEDNQQFQHSVQKQIAAAEQAGDEMTAARLIGKQQAMSRQATAIYGAGNQEKFNTASGFKNEMNLSRLLLGAASNFGDDTTLKNLSNGKFDDKAINAGFDRMVAADPKLAASIEAYGEGGREHYLNHFKEDVMETGSLLGGTGDLAVSQAGRIAKAGVMGTLDGAKSNPFVGSFAGGLSAIAKEIVPDMKTTGTNTVSYDSQINDEYKKAMQKGTLTTEQINNQLASNQKRMQSITDNLTNGNTATKGGGFAESYQEITRQSAKETQDFKSQMAISTKWSTGLDMTKSLTGAEYNEMVANMGANPSYQYNPNSFNVQGLTDQQGDLNPLPASTDLEAGGTTLAEVASTGAETGTEARIVAAANSNVGEGTALQADGDELNKQNFVNADNAMKSKEFMTQEESDAHKLDMNKRTAASNAEVDSANSGALEYIAVTGKTVEALGKQDVVMGATDDSTKDSAAVIKNNGFANVDKLDFHQLQAAAAASRGTFEPQRVNLGSDFASSIDKYEPTAVQFTQGKADIIYKKDDSGAEYTINDQGVFLRVDEGFKPNAFSHKDDDNKFEREVGVDVDGNAMYQQTNGMVEYSGEAYQMSKEEGTDKYGAPAQWNNDTYHDRVASKEAIEARQAENITDVLSTDKTAAMLLNAAGSFESKDIGYDRLGMNPNFRETMVQMKEEPAKYNLATGDAEIISASLERTEATYQETQQIEQNRQDQIQQQKIASEAKEIENGRTSLASTYSNFNENNVAPETIDQFTKAHIGNNNVDAILSNPEGYGLNEDTTNLIRESVTRASNVSEHDYNGTKLTDENLDNMSEEDISLMMSNDDHKRQLMEIRHEELTITGSDNELKNKLGNALGKGKE